MVERQESPSPVLELSDNRAQKALRSGDLCPQCKRARLEYDGLLNLSCPDCGYALAGGCT